MTLAAQRILIIGGGFSGMSAAIELRKRGAEVDLIEMDPGWRSYGAGISLGGATLRAFRTLGVLDAFLEQGYAGDGVDLFTPAGHKIATLPTPRIAGAEVPGGGAIMRPVLAKILADATRAGGTQVYLGCTVVGMAQDAEGVDVTFSDGRRSRYDLVVAADGLYSSVRQTVFADAPKPSYSGQAVWRCVLPRPDDVRNAMMWIGPQVKVGVNPVSVHEMYLFVTENRSTNERVDESGFVAMLRHLLADFEAPLLRALRDQIDENSLIVFRPLKSMLMPQPWHQGRVVLIGDAVHATTPHLASGACIGIEDALVLSEQLAQSESIATALQAFEARRWERCRMVVENSARLGEIEITGGDKAEHARIMRESQLALAAAI